IGVGDAGTKAHVRRMLHAHGHHRIRVRPQDGRIIKPAMAKAADFSLGHQVTRPLRTYETFETNTEFHKILLTVSLTGIAAVGGLCARSPDAYAGSRKRHRFRYVQTNQDGCEGLDTTRIDKRSAVIGFDTELFDQRNNLFLRLHI